MSTAAEDVPEAAVDPSTKDILVWIGKIVIWVARPITTAIYYIFSHLSRALLALAKLIYEPLSFIFAPVIYVAYFLLTCLQAPFTFLAKFETLYIYLSVGALIGITGGLLLNFIYGLLQGPLGLNTTPEHPGRTAKQYREEKQREQESSESLRLSPSLDSPSSGYFSMSDQPRKTRKGKGLLNQTIMEEVDSDY